MRNSLPFALPQAIQQHPLTVTADTPTTQAISLMSQTKSSCVLIVATPQLGGNAFGKLLGIFTERDVVRVTAANLPLEQMAIGEVMTQQPFSVTQPQTNDTLNLLNLFRKHLFRHLPIVDDQGNLVGLITHQSIREVLKPVDWMRLRRVAEVMTTEVIQVSLSASILQIAQKMAQRRVSCVVIAQEPENYLHIANHTEESPPPTHSYTPASVLPIGIITERDIVQFRALGLDLHQTKAETVMSTPLLPIRPTDSLIVAHELMRKHRIRRLVVLGEDEKLVGLITQTSLLQALDPMEVDASITALQRVIEERTTELVQANQRLEIEIQERQQTESALRLSEARLAGILNIADDAIISINEQMQVELFNQGAEKMFGYTAREVLQQPIDLLLPSGFTKAHRQHILNLCESADRTSNEMGGRQIIWMRRKDRREFPTEASISKLIVREEKVWTIILRDITNRVQAEETLRHQMSRERLIAKIALRIRQSLDIHTILNTTVAEVRQFLACDRVIIYRFQPDWSGIVAVESVGPGWGSILGTVIEDLCFTENYLERYEQGCTEEIEDIYTSGINQCRIDLLAPLQVRANLVVPILKENRTTPEQMKIGLGENSGSVITPAFNSSSLLASSQSTAPLWGLLGAHQCSRARRWQDWEIDFLKQLATQVAIAIQQGELYQQLLAANQQLVQLASLDGLTQIANRRRFDEYLNLEWRRLLREKQPISLILCDVDFFKAYNDYYGHLAGDFCLQQVATGIRQSIKRPADLVARYGGEEFAVILPNTPFPGAIHFAEEIRRQIAALNIHHPKSLASQYITLSLGVATTIPEYQSSPAKLIGVADQALYQAKAQGRNTYVAKNL